MPVSKETVRVLRKQEGLQIRRKQRKRRAFPSADRLRKSEYLNHVWSWDFMFDVSDDQRKIKILNVIDEYSRECLVSIAARNISARDVFRILQRLFVERGLPAFIRSDNGPEFVAKFIQAQLQKLGIRILYISPGSPWQNAYIESFNSIIRDSVLNRWIFRSVREAQVHLDNYRTEYNQIRPHGSLNDQTPVEFSRQLQQQQLLA